MPQNGLKLHTPFLKGGPSTTQKRGGLRQLPHSPYPISTTACNIYLSNNMRLSLPNTFSNKINLLMQISVVADLPGVGSNLKDHLFMNVGFAFPSVTDPMFKLSDLVRTY